MTQLIDGNFFFKNGRSVSVKDSDEFRVTTEWAEQTMPFDATRSITVRMRIENGSVISRAYKEWNTPCTLADDFLELRLSGHVFSSDERITAVVQWDSIFAVLSGSHVLCIDNAASTRWQLAEEFVGLAAFPDLPRVQLYRQGLVEWREIFTGEIEQIKQDRAIS